MKLRKLALALAVVMMATLALAGSVSADQPEVVYDGPFENVWDIFDCSWLGPEYGYDFHVMRHDIGEAYATNSYDKDGVKVKMFEKDRGTLEWYSDANPNYKIATKFELQLHFDLVTADPELWHLRYTGNYYNINMPGYGPVIRFAGQSEQIFGAEVPPTELKSVGNILWDFPTLCEILAP